jgi:WD40 repeat protein
VDYDGASCKGVAGWAADAIEAGQLAEDERGTLSIFSSSSSIQKNSADDSNGEQQEGREEERKEGREGGRKLDEVQRFQPCSVGEGSSGGKPGVGCVAVRHEREGVPARLFAVGGWDKRIRIYGFSSSKKGERKAKDGGKVKGILKGHEGSVNALEWAPASAKDEEGSSSSGDNGMLLASAGEDCKICIWSLYPPVAVAASRGARKK